jgi:hypothetical protein
MIRGLVLVGLFSLSYTLVNAAEEKKVEPSAELRAFAQQLVKIAETKDRQALAKLIDFERILEQSAFMKCKFDSDYTKKEFAKGFIRAGRDIEKDFYNKYLPDHKLVSLLQIKPLTDRESLVILRYFLDQDSDYLVFRVFAEDNQSFKIIDLSNGSDATSFVSAMELGVLAMHSAPIVKTLGVNEPLREWLVKNQKLYAEFIMACGTGDSGTVIKHYPQLPLAIKNINLIEYNYYRANARVDKSKLKLEDFQAYYAKHHDPATLQLVLNYSYSQALFETILATYDEFDRLLGKDPLNNMHRALVLVDAGKPELAYPYARQLIQDFPEWNRSYITLMVVALFDNNYKLVLHQLQILRDKFQVNLTEHIEMNEDYKDFLKSPEYAVWKKENATAAEKEKQ